MKIKQKSSKMINTSRNDKTWPGPGWGPYGPIWGPYGSSWTGPDMTKSGLLVEFGAFRVQKWYFDEMT